MKRDGFLLGLLATSGQVLLLRELVVAFGGSELFIGTALFGWLIWVALGAWVGGRFVRGVGSMPLFLIASLVLPLSLFGARLLPLLVTSAIGETIPLTTAMPLSMVAMAPMGLLCGWLFPVIARSGSIDTRAITTVYLFEGLGAFVAGVSVKLLVGGPVGNLGMSLAVGAVVMLGAAAGAARVRAVSISAGAILALLLVVTAGGSRPDRSGDKIRFPGYAVRESFDTRCGHEVILSRDSALVLVTDNAVEATAPDLETAENLLIPPIVYLPSTTSFLYVGRTEFGLAELVAELPDIHLTAVDPRGTLSERLEAITPRSESVTRIDDDPLAFLTNTPADLFDAVVVNLGRLDSYRSSRLLTPESLKLVRRSLKEHGLLLLRTAYDTDRYVSDETADLLSTILATLRGTFANLAIWPGTSTLVMASQTLPLDLPLDSIIARTEALAYEPYYVGDYYLRDRLNELKVARVHDALSGTATANGIRRPLLTTMDSWYRARASESDRALAGLVLKRHYWLIVFPIAVVLFFLWAVAGRRNRGRIGMLLYFTAGVVSLSLELVSFYVYQSTAGSLYSSLAVLIGTFMLGLALGTWLAERTVGLGIGWLALATLLAATALFGFTWSLVDFGLALVYHLLFLFVVSLATGTLFVAATRCYYGVESGANRGLGYAAELGGSALGALLTTTVLLPVLGISWLLATLAMLSIVALIGQRFRRLEIG